MKLAGDKFMPEMHLKKPGFPYNACGSFRRKHYMAYGKSKDLAKRTQSDKVLRDKAFKISSDPKYVGCQKGLTLIVYKSFDKKSRGSGVDAEQNYQLANELHRQIIRRFNKRRVYSSFRDNI